MVGWVSSHRLIRVTGMIRRTLLQDSSHKLTQEELLAGETRYASCFSLNNKGL